MHACFDPRESTHYSAVVLWPHSVQSIGPWLCITCTASQSINLCGDSHDREAVQLYMMSKRHVLYRGMGEGDK